jgi:hypothetical protein
VNRLGDVLCRHPTRLTIASAYFPDLVRACASRGEHASPSWGVYSTVVETPNGEEFAVGGGGGCLLGDLDAAERYWPDAGGAEPAPVAGGVGVQRRYRAGALVDETVRRCPTGGVIASGTTPTWMSPSYLTVGAGKQEGHLEVRTSVTGDLLLRDASMGRNRRSGPPNQEVGQ